MGHETQGQSLKPIEQLFQSLDNMQEVIKELEAALSSVLLIKMDNSGPENATGRPMVSPLTQQIQEAVDRVRAYRNELKDLHDRIQI